GISLVRDILLAVEGEPALGGAHTDEIVEAVAGVDVEVPAHGSEAMGGIQIRVDARVPGSAPEPFVLRLEQYAAQVVEIRGLGMKHVTEDACVDHPVHEHLVVTVVAVLELQTMALRFFARIDERPELL